VGYEHLSPLTYLAAFGGGLVSFLSPCVLPIVPGYLSLVTGLDIAELQQGSQRRLVGIARDTGLFIAGFSTVFVLLGLSATSIGQILVRNQLLLTRISGVLVLSMALFMIGSIFLRAPWLYQEKRFHPEASRFGPFAPPIAGAAFGFGWTPCIGPVLGSILAVAATQQRVWAGASLLAVYSLGLGVPFLVTGLALGHLAGAFAWIKRHATALVVVASVSLGLFGVLLVFNRLVWVTSRLQEALRAVGLESLVNLG
jgi:cytochrome c-type biogenesis protein